MKKITLSRKLVLLLLLGLFSAVFNTTNAQTYTWDGTTADFYTASNWTRNPAGTVVFDNSMFFTVVTDAVTGPKVSPVISSFVDWQPGIFNSLGGDLTVNADFNVYFNDFLNGNITVNTGAIFTCRNIFRLGSEGTGTLNVNGGTFRSNDCCQWQGIFIGARLGGNGTANINNNGVIDGGYQLEIGTRNFYPTGVLNVNTGGTAGAFWNTVIGPNGIVNINGGTLNTGQGLIVGDLYVDNPGNEGTTSAVVGALNINSGTVTVNQFDLASPAFILNSSAKLTIDAGSLIIKQTGVDFTTAVNDYVTGGQIVPAIGKKIVVVYDGTSLTTVTAIPNLSVANFDVSNAFAIYPNPVQDVINIMPKSNFNSSIKVTIVNLAGQTIMERQIEKNNSGAYSISTQNKLSSGMYLVKISADKATYSSKIIVK